MRGAMIKVWRASLGSCYLEPISGRQRSVARRDAIIADTFVGETSARRPRTHRSLSPGAALAAIACRLSNESSAIRSLHSPNGSSSDLPNFEVTFLPLAAYV